MKPPISLDELHEIIGLNFIWKNDRYIAIEIIDQPPALIAQKCHPDHAIQSDVHGRAHREVSTTISIPVLVEDGSRLHPEFLLIKF
ncbi:hypothetical protein CAP31_03965 [Sulfuriferula sp. AH1]|uniref:hypothetical protein n=1 Tax=Sulfuriferula sp. AH1 TaxID=1985873 RepID=UPI000B3B809C|nr:hypothetical protein [Sulfuriferula sp. AH1]ARU30916.1 hypothetical protein CAP31_03965 [Sulfuriferula sp. AH1]